MKKVCASLVFACFFCAVQAQCWQSISAGGSHTMAIKPDGTLWGWGSNMYGQLGGSSSNLPSKIGTDTDWKIVVAGENNTFAIKTDGTLWGWGENMFGQVGNGTIPFAVTTPTKIGTATNWKSVVAASQFTAAIKTDGTLWTWGGNIFGLPGFVVSPVPNQVGTATDWKEVSLGINHAVALKTDNTLWAWGVNNSGQIGKGAPSEDVINFQIGSNEWRSVSAGSGYTMAIKLDGTLWAWGSNYMGQLGIGNRSEIFVPVQVGSSTWKSVHATTFRTIAIKSNGTLWLWGDRVPDNMYDEPYLVPHQRTTYSDWETVSSYSEHSFAIRADKSVWSEGDGNFGKLGEYVEYRLEPEPFSVVVPSGDAVQTICTGGTIADLKATGTDIKWYEASSGGSPIPETTALVHGKRYYASSTKHGCESALRLDVTVVVNPTVTPPPTGPTEQKFCEYIKVSDLTITGSNIKWYESSLFGNEIASSTSVPGGTRTYYASQTLGYCESVRLPVEVTVNPTAPPTGNTAQTRCPGSALWSLAISGNSLRYYQTESSTTPLASTTTLVNGPIFVTQNLFGLESCDRLRIDVTVKTTDPPTGDAEQVLCSGFAYVFQLNVTGEEIRWFDSPAGGNNVSNSPVVNGNFYYAEQLVQGCASVGRLKVKALINSTPVPEYTGEYTYCHGITLGELPMNGINIRWYGADGTELPPNTPVQQNDDYYASQTIGDLESCNRTKVSVSVMISEPPFIDPIVYVCNGGTVADLYSINRDTNLKWYENESGGSALPSTTPLVNGKHYWATITWTIAECESPGRSETTLEINPTPTPPMTGGGTIIACNGGFFNLPIQGTDIKWYETAGSTTPLHDHVSVVHGENYFATQTINGCESPRTEYVIDLQTPPPAPAPFADPEWKSISKGGANIGVRKDGTLWGWGYNGQGQLTNGIASDRLSWATPISFETWKVVEAGPEETFGIKNDGTLWHWGKETIYSNDENHTNKIRTPTQIGDDNTWEKLSTGGGFTLGLKTDGSLWAWGYNFYGVLGDGTLLHSNTPKQVGSATDWMEVSAEDSYVLAIKTDGTLWGWGESSLITRQPIYNDRILTPVKIGTSDKWRKIDTGYRYWFGIQDDGSLWIGGHKYVGTSGNTFSTIDPERFYSDSDWKEVSVGGNSALGIKNNGTLWALYGVNEYGQLGFDKPLPQFAHIAIIVPRQVGTDTDWSVVKAGWSHSLALKNDGSLWATGSNEYQQLAVHPKYEFSDPSDYYRDRFTPVRSVLVDTDCNELTLADLKATGANIEWTDGFYSPDPVPLNIPLVDGARFFGRQTTTVCPSADKFFHEIRIVSFPAPVGSSTEQFPEVETQSFCGGATVADLVAHGADIKWYDAPGGGTQLLSTSLLVNNQHYYASQTFDGCEGTERLEVIASVGPTDTPTGDPSQRSCYGGTVSDLVATGSNIKWYSSETSETPLSLYAELEDDTYYYATQTVNGCESVSRLAVLVSVGTVPPTGNAFQFFCLVASVADLVATGSSIKWYTTESGGAPLDGPITLVDGHHYFASQVLDGCESKSRFEVTVSLGIPAPTGDATQSFCLAPDLVALVAIGDDIKWYAAPTGGSPISGNTKLQDGHHYYASQNIDGCESLSRLNVTVSIGTKAPGGDPSQTVCPGATVAKLVAEGSEIKWYSESSGGELLVPTTSLTTGATYYATQTVDDCESETRLAVTVMVGAGPPIVASSQHFTCGSTIGDLKATGTRIQWYSTSRGGTALSANTILEDGITYYASQSIDVCESDRVATVVSIGLLAAPGGDTEQEFCSEAKVVELVATGSNIKWYKVESGGTAINPNTELEDETFYYAEQSNSVCVSATRLKVQVSLNVPAVPGGLSVQVVEPGKRISDLRVVGENIRWYKSLEDARRGFPPLSPNDSLANGKSYFATQTVLSCESDPLEVTVVFEVIQGLEPELPGLRIYPNPARNVVFIEYAEPIDRAVIVSIVGRTVAAKAVNNNTAEFDLSGLSSGVYFIHIHLDHQVIIRKIVKD